MRWTLLAFVAAIAAITVVALGMSPEPTKEDPWARLLAERRESEAREKAISPSLDEIKAEGPVIPLFIPANYGMESEFAAAMPEFTLRLPATSVAEKPLFIGGGWSPLADLEPAVARTSLLYDSDEAWYTQTTGGEEPLFVQADEPRFDFAMMDPIERANHRLKELGSGGHLVLLGLGGVAFVGAALVGAKHQALVKSRKRRSHPAPEADIQMGSTRPEPRVSPTQVAAQVPPPGNRQATLAPARRERPAHPKATIGAIGALLLAIAAVMFAAMIAWGA